MESSEVAVAEGYVVVESNQFHEHIGDDGGKDFGIAFPVVFG